jgi:hypothetical protein
MALITSGSYGPATPTIITMAYALPQKPYVVYSSPPYTPLKYEPRHSYCRDFSDDSDLTDHRDGHSHHDYSQSADSCYERSPYGLPTPQRYLALATRSLIRPITLPSSLPLSLSLFYLRDQPYYRGPTPRAHSFH